MEKGNGMRKNFADMALVEQCYTHMKEDFDEIRSIQHLSQVVQVTLDENEKILADIQNLDIGDIGDNLFHDIAYSLSEDDMLYRVYLDWAAKKCVGHQ